VMDGVAVDVAHDVHVLLVRFHAHATEAPLEQRARPLVPGVEEAGEHRAEFAHHSREGFEAALEQYVGVVAHEAPSVDLHPDFAAVPPKPLEVEVSVNVVLKYVEQAYAPLVHVVEARCASLARFRRHARRLRFARRRDGGNSVDHDATKRAFTGTRESDPRKPAGRQWGAPFRPGWDIANSCNCRWKRTRLQQMLPRFSCVTQQRH